MKTKEEKSMDSAGGVREAWEENPVRGATIERDAGGIRFHKEGTLNAVTRWVGTHDEGLAEWLKNSRRAYQQDRANVADEHRSAALLFKDAGPEGPPRIGLLDVGGVTLEDVEKWSTWQDPQASSRASGMAEDEETQGNGGKAYMYRMFAGPARICGVRDGRRNRKGFEGPAGTVERGTPGFVPDAATGRELPITSWEAELEALLAAYGTRLRELPEKVQRAIEKRESFTLVEGEDPKYARRGRFIDAEDLVSKVVRHEQSTLALEQLDLYAMHNGQQMNGGRPLELSRIEPYPGLEEPFVYEIPEELPLEGGDAQSTTEGGTRPQGRLILHTSKDNMPAAHKNLKPRWKISYRTQHQMIGAKPVSDFAEGVPGAKFVYGTAELPALEPGYVEHGRRRPKDGPLVEALDIFVGEKIREVAKEISNRRKRDLDDRALDEVQKENKKLDEFKNQFLDSEGPGDKYDGPPPPPSPPPPPGGVAPSRVELRTETVRLGRGVELRLGQVVNARVKDEDDNTVASSDAPLEWVTSYPHVAEFSDEGVLTARSKGAAEAWARVKGTSIESERVPLEVWAVDHVLLTPRTMTVRLGEAQRVTAEVTNDEGERSTDVYLDWAHDADDQFVVRVRQNGQVAGNRIGTTAVTAGAGDPEAGGVWARIPVEVEVTDNPDEADRNAGFPRLLLTGRDVDPSTGEVREGDPDEPALWQETVDYYNNVWWLNLQTPEAAFSFGRREDDPALWRSYHVQRLIDMVVQVHMQEEYTKQGENERPDFWGAHKGRQEDHQVQVVARMWEALEGYVTEGELDAGGDG